mgnify:CR=1 FL=1|tara:strand:+ start:856 stop:1929 length:1074 start_codon:yes stop_codon:yes gene_type:complete
MKLLWYIPRLNLGGAESLTITVLNFLSKFHSVILVTDIKKSSEINQIKKNIKIINLDDASGLLYFLKLYKLRKIVKKFKKFKFVSNLTHANLNSYISLLFLNIKIIGIEHNTLSEYLSHKKNFKNLVISVLCKFIYKRIDKIICVSNYVSKNLEKNYGCKNCITIHNAVDRKKIILKSKSFNYKSNEPYIIFVGRLEKQKNLFRLLKIYKKLVQSGIMHNLIIIGDGSELENLKKEVQKIKLIKKVFFLGKQKNPYPYIRNADLSIMTSHFEGFGIFLIESLVLGVKIFTYDNKIINEISNNKEFAHKFTANKSDIINIKKIKLLLNSKTKKNKLQNLAIPYDIKNVSKKYIKAFTK